jgi:hypothetical protein
MSWTAVPAVGGTVILFDSEDLWNAAVRVEKEGGVPFDL